MPPGFPVNFTSIVRGERTVSGKTIVEKIISAHAGRDLHAGDLCVAELDFTAGTETKCPRAVRMFEELGLPLHRREQVAIAMDHFVPSTNAQRTNNQKKLRQFAEKEGIRLFLPGEGISLQLFMEHHLLYPGALGGIADSHASSLGAVNCCCLAIGETELATAMATGKLWLKVPESIKVELKGTLSPGVYAKDAALALMGLIGTEGASYQVLEFCGDALKNLGMGERFTLCNMVSDIGAKTAIMPGDERTEAWMLEKSNAPGQVVNADPDASYCRTIELDLGSIEPMLSCPHSVDNVHAVSAKEHTTVSLAIIGSCTNGRLEDLRAAAAVLKDRHIHPSVRMLVTPASRRVLLDANAEGLIDIFVKAGAMVMPPACGPCTSFTQIGVPGDGDNVISSANRNFKGRLGNKSASIYLASPATVAASALTGHIADPRPYFCRRQSA